MIYLVSNRLFDTDTYKIATCQDVLDYFGMSKHMFYKLKKANAIRVPEYISNRSNSNRNKRKENI
jgi:hypothetical protein